MATGHSSTVDPDDDQLNVYFLRKDGTEIAVEIGLNPIETRDGSFTVSSIMDADELKRARSLVLG